MPKHVVSQGEGISSIADQHGFSPATLWDHPDNAGLRETREDPDILAPGDEVSVPDKRPKDIDCQTGKRHRFRRLGVPALLRLQVFVGSEKRVNQPYRLEIDGVVRRGTTDDDGVLTAGVSPQARRAKLWIGPDDHELDIRLGHVDPLSTLAGVQSRLQNLGFDCGSQPGVMDAATRAALLAFQELAGIPATDDWQDAATRDALQKLHDTREWKEPEAGEGDDEVVEELHPDDVDD
ncbi:MAG: peptidoglycan-binding domain-containing protein [Polyangiaceae bacterium]